MCGRVGLLQNTVVHTGALYAHLGAATLDRGMEDKSASSSRMSIALIAALPLARIWELLHQDPAVDMMHFLHKVITIMGLYVGSCGYYKCHNRWRKETMCIWQARVQTCPECRVAPIPNRSSGRCWLGAAALC